MNSNSEILCEGQSSGDKLLQGECLNNKGKILECDVQESGFQEKTGLKKNGSLTEATTSTIEKEMVMPRTRTPVKVRQTCSGPLMPGAVLTHSASERGRLSERFIMVHYLFVLHLGLVVMMLSSLCKSSVLLAKHACSFIITLHKLVLVRCEEIEPNWNK